MMLNERGEIVILENDHLAHYWPHITRALEQCRHVWEDNYTISGLLTEAIAKRCQVWAIGKEKWDLILFTEVLETQKGRTLRLFLMVGHKLDDYVELIDATLERYAAIIGCGEIKIVGRRGWLRKLRKIGFREDSTTLSRPVRGHLNG